MSRLRLRRYHGNLGMTVDGREHDHALCGREIDVRQGAGAALQTIAHLVAPLWDRRSAITAPAQMTWRVSLIATNRLA